MTDRVVFATSKYIELVIEGTGCDEQFRLMMASHAFRMEEDQYGFLFFARDWFHERGYSTKIRVREEIRGVKKALLQAGIAMIERMG